MPGIGELPGGITGCCALPVGSTGAAGGFIAGGVVGVPGDGVVSGRGARRLGGGSGSPPIVTGGPVSAMLLCVPM